MVSTLGDDAPALSSVKKWAAEFKSRRESLEDDSRSGRLSIATSQENIDRIHQMIMNNTQLTISHLANVVSNQHLSRTNGEHSPQQTCLVKSLGLMGAPAFDT